MNYVGIFLTVSSVLGTIYYLAVLQKNEGEIDPYSDYEIFLDAASDYKDENGEYAKDIKLLLPLMPPGQAQRLPLKRYSLSLDGKFLVIKGLSDRESNALINEIGGDSYINGHLVYLTLLRLNDLSEVKPIAHFIIRPDNKINTMTILHYETNGCVAEDNEILEKKWEGRQTTFRAPGTYTVSLKIKDKNNNWSEAFTREIKVTEEPGVSCIASYSGSLFYAFKSGRVLSKGKNEYGQLGLGGLNPVQELSYNSMYDGVAEIACGENFNLFKFNDGNVFGAGDNRNGELGTGDKTPQRTLNAVWGLENIKQIAAGKRFAAALDAYGEIYVWGDNSENQLMKEDIKESLLPIKLDGVDNIKQIALGANFGLALKYDGTVVGWGDNNHGQLAIGYKGHINEPVVTLYKNVTYIAAGDRYSLVVNDKGHVLGCGNNSHGQLGTKGKAEVMFPQEVMKIKSVKYLYAKDSLVMAVTDIGKAFVWGNFNAPGVRPIFEPEEVPGIQYIKAAANNGKKCFAVDDKNMFYTIADTNTKHEAVQMYETFMEYQEKIINKMG